jgi:hypothetical protein
MFSSRSFAENLRSCAPVARPFRRPHHTHSLSRSCLIPLHGMGDSLPKHANRRASTDTDRRRRAHAHKHRHRCTRVHRETDRETEHKRTAHTGQLRNAHHSPAWGSAAYQPERPMRNETRYSSFLPLAVSTAKPSPCIQCRSFAPCDPPAQCRAACAMWSIRWSSARMISDDGARAQTGCAHTGRKCVGTSGPSSQLAVAVSVASLGSFES